MDAVSLLSQQVQQANGMLSGTIADLTAGQAQWSPGGKAVPAGPMLAHAIMAEDFFLNMTVGRQPLEMTSFAGKMGISEPPPMGRDWQEWAGRVKVDLPALNEYAQAVLRAQKTT